LTLDAIIQEIPNEAKLKEMLDSSTPDKRTKSLANYKGSYEIIKLAGEK
jgi:hypothetical protein